MDSGVQVRVDMGFYIEAVLWALLESLHGFHVRPAAAALCLMQDRFKLGGRSHHPEVDRIWGIQGTYQGSFKIMFYLLQASCKFRV